MGFENLPRDVERDVEWVAFAFQLKYILEDHSSRARAAIGAFQAAADEGECRGFRVGRSTFEPNSPLTSAGAEAAGRFLERLQETGIRPYLAMGTLEEAVDAVIGDWRNGSNS